MASTTNFSVRMDSDIKKQCETLYGELGMNLTTGNTKNSGEPFSAS